MNHVSLSGRLTGDPNVTYTQGQNPMTVARFNLAVDRKYKREGQPTADFINCVAFSKTAEFIEKYVKKGTKIIVSEGSWQTGSYTDKNNNKVYTNDCIVYSVEFAESKKPEDKPQENKPQDDGFMNIPDGIDEELPFN